MLNLPNVTVKERALKHGAVLHKGQRNVSLRVINLKLHVAMFAFQTTQAKKVYGAEN